MAIRMRVGSARSSVALATVGSGQKGTGNWRRVQLYDADGERGGVAFLMSSFTLM